MFLYGYKNLVRVHRLDKVVCDLASYSLVHDVFLFALRYHYDRHMRLPLFYHRQGFKTGQAWHVLVKYDKVEASARGYVEGVAAVVGRCHLISFVPQEHYVWFEKVDFVVGPKYVSVFGHIVVQSSSKSGSSPSLPISAGSFSGFSAGVMFLGA